MSRDYEYESELTGSREEIAAILSGVLDGVTAGSIRLSDGTETVTAAIPDHLEFDFELEVEDDEVSLELELTWPVPDGEESAVSLSEGLPEERPEPATPVEGTDPLQVEATDPAHPPARFEVFRDRGDKWRWRLRHRNGNIIATSGQGYTRKHNAWKGLRSVIQNAPQAELTETSTD